MHLRFPTDSTASIGAYRIIELPPDVLKLIEDGSLPNGSLVIKGKTTDDAVLCTPSATYALRSITTSNSLAIVTGASSGDSENTSGQEHVVIRDQLHEILELVPIVPKLDRLDALLRGAEYQQGEGDEDYHEDKMDIDGEEGEELANSRRYTYEEIRGTVQASDTELRRGLLRAHVLTLDGVLRPLPLAALTHLLLQIITALVSESFVHEAVPVTSLASVLQSEHEVRPDLTRQVIVWFGHVQDDKWKVDIDALVTQVGLGLLSEHKDETIDEKAFVDKWKLAVGDTFERHVSLKLLIGNYLTSEGAFPTLSYFPASGLPPNPTARFADLFLTRSKWRADQIAPFLHDIAVDTKDRDKLLLKYCRMTTDADGAVWYTARAKY